MVYASRSQTPSQKYSCAATPAKEVFRYFWTYSVSLLLNVTTNYLLFYWCTNAVALYAVRAMFRFSWLTFGSFESNTYEVLTVECALYRNTVVIFCRMAEKMSWNRTMKHKQVTSHSHEMPHASVPHAHMQGSQTQVQEGHGAANCSDVFLALACMVIIWVSWSWRNTKPCNLAKP